jgi:hypothetical protein
VLEIIIVEYQKGLRERTSQDSSLCDFAGLNSIVCCIFISLLHSVILHHKFDVCVKDACVYVQPEILHIYEGVSKSFRPGRLERELWIIQLSATRCSFIAILRVSLVSYAAITLYVLSQRVFIVAVLDSFVIDSVRTLLDTPPYSICCEQIENSRWCLLPWGSIARNCDSV